MNKLILSLLCALPVAAAPQSQPPAGSELPCVAVPKTTQVLVLETPKEGVTFAQVFAVMPREARATVKLYLDGKIREWYSRGDGKGVVFLVDAKSVGEAREIIESLPLAKEQLMESQYIPIGPLVPLRVLLGPRAQE